MKSYIKKIIVPFVNSKRKQLSLNGDHRALAIVDRFKGQCIVSDLLSTKFGTYIRLYLTTRIARLHHPTRLSIYFSMSFVRIYYVVYL